MSIDRHQQQHRPHRRRRFRVRPEALGLGWNDCTAAVPTFGSFPHSAAARRAETDAELANFPVWEQNEQEHLQWEALQRGTFWGAMVCLGLIILLVFLALGMAEHGLSASPPREAIRLGLGSGGTW